MLEGELVRLRPLEPEDADNYYRWLNDADVKQYLAQRYFISRTAEVEWLRARSGSPMAYDNVTFAVETLAQGRHIGSVGIHDTRAEDRKATVGIVIGAKDLWDKGYGTDAMRTLLRFMFEEMNLHRVMLHVDERNDRAIAAYKKCGFREEGRMRHDRFALGRYWDTVVMSILEDEFRALPGATP
jgi:RimJ/RimL family protein N-acetyltransferase